jgi:hypothetical protein
VKKVVDSKLAQGTNYGIEIAIVFLRSRFFLMPFSSMDIIMCPLSIAKYALEVARDP